MKRLITFMLSLLLIFSLTACKQEDPVKADSYWILQESIGDIRSGELPENLFTDLTLWSDGTARIREIEKDILLYKNQEEWNLTWTQEEDGTLNLYNEYSKDIPYTTGKITEDSLEITRFEGTFRFQKESMPKGGALYSPAELRGVWIQVNNQVDGHEEESLPETFNSLIFDPVWITDTQVAMRASSESGDSSGLVTGGRYYEKQLTILNEPIDANCENDVWCARIGDESPLNEYGNLQEMETYVTLLNHNTLYQQHRFSKDDGHTSVVTCQTYQRVLPSAVHYFEREDLEGTHFELDGYIDADGNQLFAPSDVSNFTLDLNKEGYQFTETSDSGNDSTGAGQYWTLGEGGTLLMSNAQSPKDCLAGAVQISNEATELRLLYKNGILRLKQIEVNNYENNNQDNPNNIPDDSVNTMEYLEGNAFAAPANAGLVYYGDEYLDINLYQRNKAIPTYIIEDGANARKILISCVLDDTPVWIETEDSEITELGYMMAGESIIIQLNYPESGGSQLCFEIDGDEYFIDLNRTSLPLDIWNYITFE